MLNLIAAILTGSTALAAAPDEICVTNGDTVALLFTVEALGGARRVEMLVPDARLCVSGARGTVGAFLDADAIEGCSRLTTADQEETLIRYTNFDTCVWAETPRP